MLLLLLFYTCFYYMSNQEIPFAALIEFLYALYYINSTAFSFSRAHLNDFPL